MQEHTSTWEKPETVHAVIGLTIILLLVICAGELGYRILHRPHIPQDVLLVQTTDSKGNVRLVCMAVAGSQAKHGEVVAWAPAYTWEPDRDGNCGSAGR